MLNVMTRSAALSRSSCGGVSGARPCDAAVQPAAMPMPITVSAAAEEEAHRRHRRTTVACCARCRVIPAVCGMRTLVYKAWWPPASAGAQGRGRHRVVDQPYSDCYFASGVSDVSADGSGALPSERL